LITKSTLGKSASVQDATGATVSCRLQGNAINDRTTPKIFRIGDCLWSASGIGVQFM